LGLPGDGLAGGAVVAHGLAVEPEAKFAY
jgi:hypothetical protein